MPWREGDGSRTVLSGRAEMIDGEVSLATIVIYNLALPNYMLGFGSGLATEYVHTLPM